MKQTGIYITKSMCAVVISNKSNNMYFLLNYLLILHLTEFLLDQKCNVNALSENVWLNCLCIAQSGSSSFLLSSVFPLATQDIKLFFSKRSSSFSGSQNKLFQDQTLSHIFLCLVNVDKPLLAQVCNIVDLQICFMQILKQFYEEVNRSRAFTLNRRMVGVKG